MFSPPLMLSSRKLCLLPALTLKYAMTGVRRSAGSWTKIGRQLPAPLESEAVASSSDGEGDRDWTED